jgi:hypothetical protein
MEEKLNLALKDVPPPEVVFKMSAVEFANKLGTPLDEKLMESIDLEIESKIDEPRKPKADLKADPYWKEFAAKYAPGLA